MNGDAKQTDKTRYAGFVAAVLAGHSALGLTFAALIYVLCLSGTVAVFSNELQRWENPQGPIVSEAPPAVLDRAVRSGFARAQAMGGVDELVVLVPTPDLPRLIVQLSGAATGVTESWVADSGGTLVSRQDAPWYAFLIGLHFRLHAPGIWGLILVGGMGLFLLALIVSGVLAHPRIFKDAFLLRRGGSSRVQEADLHNRLSVWGLPFHFIIAFTGAYLGLAPIIMNFVVGANYQGDLTRGFFELYGPGPGSSETEAPLPDIDAITAGALERSPDAAIQVIVVQNVGTEGQIVHVTTKRPNQLNEAERHFFDGAGKLLRIAGNDDGPAGMQIAAAMIPLHYGWFGGWAMKLVYGVLGAALTIITASGVTIWVARWRDKGKPRLAWQRVWTAVVWGQPIAMALAALSALAGTSGLVLPAYAVLVACTLIPAALLRDNERLSRFLKRAGALSLFALAGTHVTILAMSMIDAMGWLVDATIVLLGAALLWLSLHRPRQPTQ